MCNGFVIAMNHGGKKMNCDAECSELEDGEYWI